MLVFQDPMKIHACMNPSQRATEWKMFLNCHVSIVNYNSSSILKITRAELQLSWSMFMYFITCALHIVWKISNGLRTIIISARIR